MLTSEITSGRVLDGELLYTKILEVNLFAFAVLHLMYLHIQNYIVNNIFAFGACHSPQNFSNRTIYIYISPIVHSFNYPITPMNSTYAFYELLASVDSADIIGHSTECWYSRHRHYN